MQTLVLSDFHLGRGKFLNDGTVNIFEDFDEDEKFVEFLEYYSTGQNESAEITIVLNGDIFNLIQMDVRGEFTHLITEDDTVEMVNDIIKGHPLFFEGIKNFLSCPHKKMIYVIGNHDLAMSFEKAQARFKQEVESEVDFTHQYVFGDVLIEHGHRFEPINTVPRSKVFIPGPGGKEIINLPWASLFCLHLLPKLKLMRPYIDKVRPLSLYVKWTIFHDFSFFCYLVWQVISYFVRTQFRPFGIYNKNFFMPIGKLLKVAIHPKYDKYAKRIFAIRPEINVVVMGHTHITEWRRFKNGKLYFNCGTWNQVPSIDAGQHKSISNLTYICIENHREESHTKNVFIKVWQGKWRPFREEVVTCRFDG